MFRRCHIFYRKSMLFLVTTRVSGWWRCFEVEGGGILHISFCSRLKNVTIIDVLTHSHQSLTLCHDWKLQRKFTCVIFLQNSHLMFNPKVQNHTWYGCENYTDNWHVWSFFRILTSCHNPTITESHFTQVWKLLTKFMCDLCPTFSPYV